MFVLMRVDYKRYRHPAIVFSLIGMTTLLLISVFLLDRSHNTHRWFRLGFLSFQPSEMAKPAIIMFLAYFLETRTKLMDDWKHTLLPAVRSVAGHGGVDRDATRPWALRSPIVMITLSVLFVAGMELKYYRIRWPLRPVIFYFLVWRVPWRHQRILAFMDPFADPLGRGFHIIQSLIAVSTGGVDRYWG